MTAWQEFKRNGKETELFSEDERDENVAVVDETGAAFYVPRYMRSNSKKGRSRSNSNGSMCCVFCRANGEAFEVYTSHDIHNKNGKTTCPVLRNYVCPMCGETGDKGHVSSFDLFLFLVHCSFWFLDPLTQIIPNWRTVLVPPICKKIDNLEYVNRFFYVGHYG